MNSAISFNLEELQQYFKDAQIKGQEISSTQALNAYIDARDEEHINTLREKFTEEFGVDKELLLTAPARELGEVHDSTLKGKEYSLPLGIYMLRRLYGEKKKDSYNLYMKAVDNLLGDDADNAIYPSKDMIQDLCKETLKDFKDIRNGTYVPPKDTLRDQIPLFSNAEIPENNVE